MLFLLFFILFPYAAALAACWTLLRHPRLWRGSLAVLLAGGASARLVLWAFRTDAAGPVNTDAAFGLMGFSQLFTLGFLLILISRVIEERRVQATSQSKDILPLPHANSSESDLANAG